MKNLFYILSGLVFLISCESRTYEEISDNTPITEVVRYNTAVKTIMDNNCISCHGAGSFKPLTTYNEVKTNIDAIIERIQKQNGDPLKMPQGGSLSGSQINVIVTWKADGLLEN